MIKTVKGNFLVVTVLSNSACSGCHAKEACSAADLKEKDIDIFCEGSEYVPGQFVNVILKESLGVKALLFGYIFPLLLVIFVLIIIFTITSNEVLSALLSLGVLIPYYTGLFFFRNSFKKIFRFELEKND
jgi:positive regulator of sigma E activity